MAWQAVVPTAKSWTTQSATAKTYGESPSVQMVWATVAPQPSDATDDGVDFELQFRDTYPLLLSDDRSLLMLSSISEGQP